MNENAIKKPSKHDRLAAWAMTVLGSFFLVAGGVYLFMPDKLDSPPSLAPDADSAGYQGLLDREVLLQGGSTKVFLGFDNDDKDAWRELVEDKGDANVSPIPLPYNGNSRGIDFLYVERDTTFEEIVKNMNPSAEAVVVAYWDAAGGTATNGAKFGLWKMTDNDYYSTTKRLSNGTDQVVAKKYQHDDLDEVVVPAGKAYAIIHLKDTQVFDMKSAKMSPSQDSLRFDICNASNVDGWYQVGHSGLDSLYDALSDCSTRVRSVWPQTTVDSENPYLKGYRFTDLQKAIEDDVGDGFYVAWINLGSTVDGGVLPEPEEFGVSSFKFEYSGNKYPYATWTLTAPEEMELSSVEWVLEEKVGTSWVALPFGVRSNNSDPRIVSYFVDFALEGEDVKYGKANNNLRLKAVVDGEETVFANINEMLASGNSLEIIRDEAYCSTFDGVVELIEGGLFPLESPYLGSSVYVVDSEGRDYIADVSNARDGGDKVSLANPRADIKLDMDGMQYNLFSMFDRNSYVVKLVKCVAAEADGANGGTDSVGPDNDAGGLTDPVRPVDGIDINDLLKPDVTIRDIVDYKGEIHREWVEVISPLNYYPESRFGVIDGLTQLDEQVSTVITNSMDDLTQDEISSLMGALSSINSVVGQIDASGGALSDMEIGELGLATEELNEIFTSLDMPSVNLELNDFGAGRDLPL
ncbi:hypothetical protein CVV38_02970 [Candidatus Peregrinibacteria bacterium HGW-Peregrinibacteria-1]|jgi:hypothetical protein|nr:MAG: hypothetical protein CVV38_02970 [Candidatus Peregrinibacteria bacterium HGW-Peregrinibacteria-1]